MTEAQTPARRLYEALKADPAGPYVSAQDDTEQDLTDVMVDGVMDLEAAAAAVFPYSSGDHDVIGPECFTDGVTISYQGENYIRQPEPADERETIDLELNITATTGVIVPCKFTIEYPEGHGFYAVKALQLIDADTLDPLWQELVQRQDAATVRVMLESGHDRGNDD